MLLVVVIIICTPAETFVKQRGYAFSTEGNKTEEFSTTFFKRSGSGLISGLQEEFIVLMRNNSN